MAMASSSRFRFEISSKSSEEIKKEVALLISKLGSISSCYDLVNNDKNDDIAGRVVAIKNIHPRANICAQYNLKCNEVARSKTSTKNYYNLRTFLMMTKANDIMFVDGDNPTMTTVKALQLLKRDGSHKKFAVTYNPFQPNATAHNYEMDRLKHIFNTGLVSKVYINYGTNLDLMRISLEFFSQFRHVKVTGSILLNNNSQSKKGKRAPSAESRQITLDLLHLYREFDVEVIVKSKGSFTVEDIDELESLMRDVDGVEKCAINGQTYVHKQLLPKSVSSSAKKQKKSTSAPNEHTIDADTAIVLFGSHDVRIRDNRALHEACRSHSKILPVFLWEPNNQGEWGVIGAMQVILKDALQNLNRCLSDFGLQLFCQNSENFVEDLVLLAKKTNAAGVYYNTEFIPESRQREDRFTIALRDLGMKVEACQSSLLYDVEELRYRPEDYGGYWGTVMYYVKTSRRQLGTPPRPISWQETLRTLKKVRTLDAQSFGGVRVEDLTMAEMPPKTQWDKPILARFCMSEEAAMERLEYFMDKGLKMYQTKERSRADLEYATSQLSAHLRIGVLSPNEMFWQTEDSKLPKEEKRVFTRRLFWRDLSYHQLYHFPSFRTKSVRVHYDDMEWVTGDEAAQRLSAWRRGKTGYPIVDAGMRELYRTGWMTQSVRIIVASFLIEYLRVHWVKGAEWFHYTLVDADSAINPMMWQNAGQSGVDQWAFLPSPFSGSQDQTGEYTKKWVPELAKLPLRHLHRPWKASEEELAKFGVILGETYPHRIVTNLREERTKSLKTIRQIRRKSPHVHMNGSDMIVLKNGVRTLVYTRKELRMDTFREPRASRPKPNYAYDEYEDEERDEYYGD